MRIDGKSTRFHERRKLVVPVKVHYTESEEESWVEETLTEEITICGAGLTLSRPVEPKRLINLHLAMPKRSRLFDHGAEIYNVWGVVQSINLLRASKENGLLLKVGIALIGKSAPKSFHAEPSTLYDLNPVLRRESFWGIRELPHGLTRYSRAYDARVKLEQKIVLETINDRGNIVETVFAITHDLSEGGMSVITKLNSACTKYLVIRTLDSSQTFLAMVRQVNPIEIEGFIKIHLELISGEWEL